MIHIPLLVLSLSASCALCAQKFPRGLPDEPDTLYASTEQKATLTSEVYRDVNAKSSLKQYAPYPGNQDYGTCAAFATAYSARTILESLQYGRTDRTETTGNTFSPGFIYRISNTSNHACAGAYTTALLDNMSRYGVPKKADYPTECPPGYPPKATFDKASRFRIKGYVRLFGEYDQTKKKVQTVKKSISDGNPVVISMICPNSFDDAKGVWTPRESPGDPLWGRMHGRHAMCVVGYDDEKYGGAFEILNSWGRNWGNDGFIWIRYTDFADFVYQALEVLHLDNTPDPAPTPPPSPTPTTYSFDGALRLVETNGTVLAAKLRNGSRTYKLQRPLSSGTRFRIYLNNTQPAYVYLLGWDSSDKVFQLFPHAPGISPALTYKKNEVAIPDEDHHIRLDENAGKDVMALIYSKKALNINTIKANLSNGQGSMEQKLIKALGSELAPVDKVNYRTESAAFSATNISQPIVLTLFEIDHY